MDEGRASAADRSELEAVLEAFDAVYDVLTPDPDELRLEEEIQALIDEREAARRAQDWGRADTLRGRLEELGILVEDTPAGPRWKRSSGA
jgi:cysteinyl-tRNA synthetase